MRFSETTWTPTRSGSTSTSIARMVLFREIQTADPSEQDPRGQEIEAALNPDAFISDRACFSFVSDLDEVAAKVAELIADDPYRAVRLYEAFLAACYFKIEEIDDSSGSFGRFVSELYCGWLKARQAGGASSPMDGRGRVRLLLPPREGLG